ncbi:MAG: hypothetical protein WEF86_08720 [Gemmatimonadota bacterium]
MNRGLPERAAAMLDRAAAEAAAVLTAADAARVRAALEVALRARTTVFDVEDARSLAPARTVRILIADVAMRSADALSASAFVDSVDEAAPPSGILSDGAELLLEVVPMPATAGDRLLEQLVSVHPDAALIAIAERLDQARHLHLRHELPWVAFHSGIRNAYIPAAYRLSPQLARRLDRWADAFARRLLLPD